MDAFSLSQARVRLALDKLAGGLEKYCWIQGRLYKGDVTQDPEFQKRFNGFYRVRRASRWCTHYYQLMETAKARGTTFQNVLEDLYDFSGNVESSFASKLVGTLDADQPVIDRFVLGNFNLRLPYSSASGRIQKVPRLYHQLCEKYGDLIRSGAGQMILREFRQRYPNAQITDLKKIDLVLCQSRD